MFFRPQKAANTMKKRAHLESPFFEMAPPKMPKGHSDPKIGPKGAHFEFWREPKGSELAGHSVLGLLCKYSQLHPNAFLTTPTTTITLHDFNPTPHRVLFASGSSWTLRHTGGSRQDTHGTPVPEREGRGWPTTCFTTDHRQTDDKRAFSKQALRQTCDTTTGADSHLESDMLVGYL